MKSNGANLFAELETAGLTKLQARLLSLLHRLASKTGYAYAKHTQLASMLECSERQVRRCLDELHIRGYVSWRRCGKRNRYFLASPEEPTPDKCPVSEPKCPVKCPVFDPKMSGLITIRDTKTIPKTPATQVAQGESPRKTSKKPPNPNHHPLVEYFCLSWQERYGAKFPFSANAGHNAKCITGILEATANDLAEAKRIVRDYLDDPDQWLATTKHPLPYLVKNVQRYIGHAEPLVNQHGCYTRPRKVTAEELERLGLFSGNPRKDDHP